MHADGRAKGSSWSELKKDGVGKMHILQYISTIP